MSVPHESGWSAEKIHKKPTETKISVTLEEHAEGTWALPNGPTLHMSGGIGTVVDSNDPKAIETAKRRHEETKKLVAQKQYKFLRTFEGSDGQTQYVYQFTLSDGSQDNMNFSMPLDKVASWDDYRRKEEEQQKKRRDDIGKAIAAGKFRLIDVDVILIHICRDTGSDQKIEVQRISLPGGKEIALISPFGLEANKGVTTRPQTSWKDHLQAVRDGKREILSVRTTTKYTYEVALEDGTKAIFNYGGGEPLKKPQHCP